MAKHGVRTLYLETGNYSHAAPVFRPADAGRFIDAAHAAGLRIVAWYLPSFLNVRIDAREGGGRYPVPQCKRRALRRASLSTSRRRKSGHSLYVTAVSSPCRRGFARTSIAATSSARSHRRRSGCLRRTGPRSRTARSPATTRRSCRWRTPRCAESTVVAATRAFLTSTVSDIRTASGDPTLPVHLIAGLSGSMGAKATAGLVDAVAQTKSFGYSLYAFGQTTPAAWRVLARRR